jgi:hypothetical protein|tara:strand:- start:109 stop:915 length:807 start_codon:yes stop_codon:yes gene_type:complete
MPNGGPDNCGECIFKKSFLAPKSSTDEPENPLFPERKVYNCTIRDLEIENPYWTYCANHWHHNPDHIDTPIGPVYVYDEEENRRAVWELSPDTEKIRAGLLELIANMKETPSAPFPSPTQLDEEIIKQLMEFREERAVPHLRRIIKFNPMETPVGDNRVGRHRVQTVALAVEALASIEGDRALDELETALRMGLSDDDVELDASGDQETELSGPLSAPIELIRSKAVMGLSHCSLDKAKPLLERAKNDPSPIVSEIANNVLNSMGTDT